MKFIKFDDKMINFGTVERIEVIADDRLSRSEKPYVYIRSRNDTLQEFFDTKDQAQARFDALIAQVNA